MRLSSLHVSSAGWAPGTWSVSGSVISVTGDFILGCLPQIHPGIRAEPWAGVGAGVAQAQRLVCVLGLERSAHLLLFI